MRKVMLIALAALMLLIVPSGLRAAVGATSGAEQVAGTCDPTNLPCISLVSTIAFSSTRDDPTGNPVLAAEIYLMDPDGTNPRRLTQNGDGDAFAALSPDGKKIVFDSNRNRMDGDPINTSDLFLMNTDGTDQMLLTRGSSAAWSPDGKSIAFHASALGEGTPIRPDPGSATSDSDLFVANVDDLVAAVEQPRNITESPNIDDDPDWSADGQRIIFTSHDGLDDPVFSNTAEIYVINPDGTGTPKRLTYNNEEERGPSWSPDGTRIVFSCRIGGGTADFELCVMNADGTDLVQLTNNSVPDLTATWAPDGQQIVFNRFVARQGLQLFTVEPMLNPDGTLPTPTQRTAPPGLNLLANWGKLRVHDHEPAQ